MISRCGCLGCQHSASGTWLVGAAWDPPERGLVELPPQGKVDVDERADETVWSCHDRIILLCRGGGGQHCMEGISQVGTGHWNWAFRTRLVDHSYGVLVQTALSANGHGLYRFTTEGTMELHTRLGRRSQGLLSSRRRLAPSISFSCRQQVNMTICHV